MGTANFIWVLLKSFSALKKRSLPVRASSKGSFGLQKFGRVLHLLQFRLFLSKRFSQFRDPLFLLVDLFEDDFGWRLFDPAFALLRVRRTCLLGSHVFLLVCDFSSCISVISRRTMSLVLTFLICSSSPASTSIAPSGLSCASAFCASVHRS